MRAHRSFDRIWKERDSAEPDILGKILDKNNLNRAYKRVKADKGAPGFDGMSIKVALPWLKEHNHKLTERIQKGKYPRLLSDEWKSEDRRRGVRKLGIPTVIERPFSRRCSNSIYYERLYTITNETILLLFKSSIALKYAADIKFHFRYISKPFLTESVCYKFFVQHIFGSYLRSRFYIIFSFSEVYGLQT